MVTTSNYGGFNTDDFETVQTNKGVVPKVPKASVAPKVPEASPKKCSKCDNTVTNEETCPQCHTLTEDAKPILLD